MTEPKRRTAPQAREQLGRALVHHMTDDFEAHGAALLSALRDEKPAEYLKLMQSILTVTGKKGATGGRQIRVIERRIIDPGHTDG